MIRTVSFLSSLLVPAMLQAQSTPQPKLEEYRLDAGHSIIEFSIGFAFSRVKGRFTAAKGTILYDNASPARSSITIVIDSKSIDTGWPHRDEHLRTSDFFDVEKYPTIVFQSERLRPSGERWLADGKLTMRGVTKPITIPFRLTQPPTRSPESNWMVINAEGALRIARADFGILGGSTFNSWFDKARAATMADSVDISLEIEAWDSDAESKRTPGIKAALDRIKTNGVQVQIDRYKAVKAAGTELTSGYLNGGDFLTRELVALGRTDDAVSLSRALTEFFPSMARAHVLHGVALAASGKKNEATREYAKAREVFRPAVVDPNEKFPQDDQEWYWMDELTRTLLERDMPGIALPVARAITDMYPQMARAFTTLGVALARTGDAKGAAAAYAKALELDPRETRALEYRRRL